MAGDRGDGRGDVRSWDSCRCLTDFATCQLVQSAQTRRRIVWRSGLRYQPHGLRVSTLRQASFCASCTSRTASPSANRNSGSPRSQPPTASRRDIRYATVLRWTPRRCRGIADGRRLQDGSERGQAFPPGRRPAAEDRREQVARIAQAIRQVVQVAQQSIRGEAGRAEHDGWRSRAAPASSVSRAAASAAGRDPASRNGFETATGRPTNSATIVAVAKPSGSSAGVAATSLSSRLSAVPRSATREAGSSWRRPVRTASRAAMASGPPPR